MVVGLSGCTDNTKETNSDADGDGYNDEVDAFPNDATEWEDTDNDGYGDNSDDFPNDENEWRDTDSDGVGDNSDDFPNDATEWLDTDGDGYGDNSDSFPTDKTEWLDTDKDGYGDNSDDYPTDSDFHEKIDIKSGYCYLIGEAYWELHNDPNWCSFEYDCLLGIDSDGIYIDSDTKYLICEMRAQKRENGVPGDYVYHFRTIDAGYATFEESINFFAQDPASSSQRDFIWEPGKDVRIPITEDNWGQWRGLGFSYCAIDYDALLEYNLYMIK